MQPIVYFDIETVPGSDPGIFEYIKANIAPPGNMSKPDSIAAWWENKADIAVKEKMAQGGLHAEYGEIACIGAALNDLPPVCFSGEQESNTLASFFSWLDALCDTGQGYRPPLLVGHNHIGFDLPFIFRRSVCREVKPPSCLPTPTELKPWMNSVADTMIMWAGPRGTISLDRLAFALGLEGKKGINGGDVASLWAAGRREEVIDYCKGDVALTRAVYKRLAFS